MKHTLVTVLLICLTVYSFGQKLPYVGPGQIFVFPNATNKFINSANISWAFDIEESYSFADGKIFEGENIFNYIISKAVSKKIEAYDLRQEGFVGFENSTYSEFNKFSNKNLSKDEINHMLSDSLKTIKFHEVFYLNNYSFNCQLISAAPLTNYVASGVSLGLQEIFFCCKNIKDTISENISNDLIHLKRVERVLNFDSITHFKIIKQTYGLNLIQSIWHGASQGKIKLFDIKSNQTIPATKVMNYSYIDSTYSPMFDSTGSDVGSYTKSTNAFFPYKLANSIKFTQDFYYDRRKNIFISTIRDCFLFVHNWDDKNYKLTIEKRFKIL